MALTDLIKSFQKVIDLKYTSELGDMHCKARVLNSRDANWVNSRLDMSNRATINETLKQNRIALAIFEIDGKPVPEFLGMDLEGDYGIKQLPESPYEWPQGLCEDMASSLIHILLALPPDAIDVLYIQYDDSETDLLKRADLLDLLGKRTVDNILGVEPVEEEAAEEGAGAT